MRLFGSSLHLTPVQTLSLSLHCLAQGRKGVISWELLGSFRFATKRIWMTVMTDSVKKLGSGMPFSFLHA